MCFWKIRPDPTEDEQFFLYLHSKYWSRYHFICNVVFPIVVLRDGTIHHYRYRPDQERYDTYTIPDSICGVSSSGGNIMIACTNDNFYYWGICPGLPAVFTPTLVPLP